LKFK
jgi:hypothetical protein